MKSATKQKQSDPLSLFTEFQRTIEGMVEFSHLTGTAVLNALKQAEHPAAAPVQTMSIIGLGTHAPTSYTQQQVLDILGYNGNKLAETIARTAAIETRSFYKTTLDFGTDVTGDDLATYHRQCAPMLAAEALRSATTDQSILTNLDAIITTTSTGFMSPGIAEVLFETYNIGNPHTLRFNLVGNGCVGSIPSLQIAQSLICSGQARSVAVVCTEAVAALFNPQSNSKMTIIQQLIFGEGGAALILGPGNAQHQPLNHNHHNALPRLLDSQQELAPHSLDAIAIRQSNYWESVTDKSIPGLVAQLVPRFTSALLERHHLKIDQVAHWAFHTGGRKILEECQSCLGLSDAQMQPSYDTLLHYGNMLSASVLFSLQQVIQTRQPQPGDIGVLIALGPGMTGGAYLMQW